MSRIQNAGGLGWRGNTINVLSFSGGKDSMMTAVLMKHYGIPIDVVLFADTGLEFSEMYEYLDVAERYIGTPITKVKADMTFEDEFYKKHKSGKFKGCISGWPMTVKNCYWRDRGKFRPMKAYKKQLGNIDEYIGISAEETDRYERLIEPYKNMHAPVFEHGITGNMGKRILRRMGILNPLYDIFHRLGCYLCPQQRLDELRKLRVLYPDYWAHMLELDKDSPVNFKPGITLRELDYRFAMENGEIDGYTYVKRRENYQRIWRLE